MDEKFIEKIFCCYRFLRKKIDQILKEKNINFIQFHILYFLNERKKINHKQLANLLNIKLPTLTIFLNNMIKSKLIKKEASKRDKREVNIVLRNDGKKILEKSRKEIKNFINLIFKNFTTKEKRTFSQLVDKINLYQ